MEKAIQNKIDLKTKPLGALGKLEKIARKIALIQNTLSPELKEPTIIVFAADHGLSQEGVSKYPKEVTYQMVMNYMNGGAGINVFCRQNDIQVKIVDAGVDYDFPEELDIIPAKIAYGTKNMFYEPAMSIEECKRALDKGREMVRKEYENGCNIIGFGEMGIGNTSSAALLMHEIIGLSIEQCTGVGTGHDSEGLKRKKEILRKISEKHKATFPLEILATFGGFEIAMMCGGMLEAHDRGMIIMVDGFIATSALLVAREMDSKVTDNCIYCHQSDEQGHKLMLGYLNADPLLNIGFRLGEATGCAVAYPLIKSAVCFLNEMASFEEAGVTNS